MNGKSIDKELKTMWGLLTCGISAIISICMLCIFARLEGLDTSIFALLVVIVVGFSSAMFVAAFVAGVDYMKAQLKP